MSTRSRKSAWLRDELVLALDLYFQNDRRMSPGIAKLRELSETLRAIPIEVELAADPSFRSTSSIARKLGNFGAIDPMNAAGGLPHSGAGDQEVWDEFSDDPARLHAAAAGIRSAIDIIDPVDAAQDDPDLESAPEGRLLTRVHVVRERSSKLTNGHKQAVLTETGKLECEGCGFDFHMTYGERGHGFIECHHTVPVSSLKPGSKTRRADLALVCANCHRMIHRAAPWLTMENLRALLRGDEDRPPV